MSEWWSIFTRDRRLIFVVALAVYGLYSLAWPLSAGRDFGTYTFYFVELFRAETLLPMVMLWRMPITPLFIGGLLTLGGSVLAEVALAAGYALTVVAISIIGSQWSVRAGWLSAGAVLAYPPYAALLHTAGSDSLFAVLYIGWAALICASAAHLSQRVMGWHGVAVFSLVMVRPVAQLLLLFGLMPYAVRGVKTRRAARAIAFFSVSVGLLLLWAAYNYVRFGDLTVARGGSIVVPLYRTFVLDRTVRADNGPASQRLTEGIERDLLTREPYRSAGVTVDEYLASGDREYFFDFVALSDRLWGWDHEYRTMREAGWEAVRQQPLVYLGGLVRAWGQALLLPYRHEQVARKSDSFAPPVTQETSSHMWWLLSTPDQRIRIDWDLGQPQIVWPNDELARRWHDQGTAAARLNDMLPARAGIAKLGNLYNEIARWWPPLIVWLVLGAAGTVVRGWQNMLPVLVPVLMGLILVGVTFLGLPHVAQYRLPFDPLFVSWGVGGCLELTVYLRRRHTKQHL